MAVVNISLPDDLLEKIDKYRKVKNENRSEFFKHAARLYFEKIEEELAFEERKKAIEEFMRIAERVRNEGVFENVDLVEEIRKMRRERTDELLGRI